VQSGILLAVDQRMDRMSLDIEHSQHDSVPPRNLINQSGGRKEDGVGEEYPL